MCFPSLKIWQNSLKYIYYCKPTLFSLWFPAFSAIWALSVIKCNPTAIYSTDVKFSAHLFICSYFYKQTLNTQLQSQCSQLSSALRSLTVKNTQQQSEHQANLKVYTHTDRQRHIFTHKQAQHGPLLLSVSFRPRGVVLSSNCKSKICC